jgi:hypothetical protein
MKFLLIVLVVHFIAEMMTDKRNTVAGTNTTMHDNEVHHPAENNLR